MVSSADSSLGFTYSACTFPTSTKPDVRRVCFRVRKVLEEVVYDTVYLENNPFTFPEVKTLMDGITVGGHRLSDADQVLNQAASWRELLRLVAEAHAVVENLGDVLPKLNLGYEGSPRSRTTSSYCRCAPTGPPSSRHLGCHI